MRLLALLALGALALLGLSACQSTQDRSAKLAKGAGRLAHRSGLTLKSSNRSVRIVSTHVLHDPNGTAAVVELENRSPRAMANVPVALELLGRDGKPLYRNDKAGLAQSLVSTPLLPPGRRVVWVDDQVLGADTARRATVRIGRPRATAPARVPRIGLEHVHLSRDTSGVFAEGVVINRSGREQRRFTIACVARRHGRIVAAGRAVVDRLPAGHTRKPIRFTVYFIGNPKGAKLGFWAPPTNL